MKAVACCCRKQHYESNESEESRKVVENQTAELKQAETLHRAGRTAEPDPDSVWVHHYEQHLSHYL